MNYQTVINLQEQRVIKASLEEKLVTAQADLQATPQYAHVRSLQEQIATLKEQLDSTRQLLERQALADFAVDGKRHIAPGINVRVERKVVYRPDKAREWCFTNYPLALVLDSKMFEQEMKHVERHASEESSGLPSFVNIEDDPKVTVASDLADAVESIRLLLESREEATP